MTDVRTYVAGNGDAWITVDPDEWIADRATHSQPLTDSLRDFLDLRDGEYRYGPTVDTSYDRHYPHSDVIAKWAHFAFRGEPGEIHSVFTQNLGDTLFDDERGYEWFGTDTHGTVLVVTTEGAYGAYVSPTVYIVDQVSDSDYLYGVGDASAVCLQGHEWDVSEATRLVDPKTGDEHRVSNYGRTTDDMCMGEGWVMCPTCGEPLTFACDAG